MIQVKITSDFESVNRALRQVGERQLPFVMAMAATRTAQKVRENILTVASSRFDRPTPTTLKSLYLKAATRQSQQARVWFKDEFGSGIPADRYLGPQVSGGTRRPKRMEAALRKRGLIEQNEWLTPTAAFQDQYGNIRGSLAIRILSGLGAAETVSGVTANASGSKRSRRKGNARRFFIAQINNDKAIWERKDTAFGEGIRPVAIITQQVPRYRVRLPFFQIAENTVKANYQRFFSEAIQRALDTAR